MKQTVEENHRDIINTGSTQRKTDSKSYQKRKNLLDNLRGEGIIKEKRV